MRQRRVSVAVCAALMAAAMAWGLAVGVVAAWWRRPLPDPEPCGDSSPPRLMPSPYTPERGDTTA